MEFILTILTFIAGGILAVLYFSGSDFYGIAGISLDRHSLLLILLGVTIFCGGTTSAIIHNRRSETFTNIENKKSAQQVDAPEPPSAAR